MILPVHQRVKPSKLGFSLVELIILVVVLGVVSAALYVRTSPKNSPYVYSLAEFVQKQQTFSPYTKYEPSFAIDKARNKVYYTFKVMDSSNIWQVWTAVSDLDGNNWQQTQQTNSPENKQRPAIIYDPQEDLLYYFYQTGSDTGSAEKIPRKLITAVKKPNQEKWHDEKVLIDNNGIDDTLVPLLDLGHRRIILTYTKNQQITTARLDLASGKLDETIHSHSDLMSFIPNPAYDESTDTLYIVFPRARAPRTFNNKDLWLARVKGDGSNYQETRLTQTDYDNTWPFITLDLPRQKFYVRFASFTEPTTYSKEGTANIKERLNLASASLDGGNWQILRNKDGFSIFGINPKTGKIYGLYQKPYADMPQGEGNERYFVVYDPAKNKLEKQSIPSGDQLTYYDAFFADWDSGTDKLWGVQQVCRSAENRGVECQIWTYHGRVLNGEKSNLDPQAKALMAPPQERKLPDLKLLSAEALGNKVKINTNRKLSMPVWITLKSGGREIKWRASQLEQIDQDRGIQLRLSAPMSSYQVNYKVCALTDPEKGAECLEGMLTYPSQ